MYNENAPHIHIIRPNSGHLKLPSTITIRHGDYIHTNSRTVQEGRHIHRTARDHDETSCNITETTTN